MARLSLGELQRRRGDVDGAVLTWRELSDDADTAVPRDYALLRAARVLEQHERLAEARLSYLQLVERFPESTYASEARQRADYLSEG
jgi:lipopolysaccharide biosynthesis regulator YciM